MIVCLCEGVNETEVRDTIQAGADTVGRVARACGAGTGCGICRHDIREFLRQCRVNDEDADEQELLSE